MPGRFAKTTWSFELQVSTQTTKLCLPIYSIDKNVALRISRNSDIQKAFMGVNFTTTLQESSLRPSQEQPEERQCIRKTEFLTIVHWISRHHLTGMKSVKWQQCSASGNEAICPWETDLSSLPKTGRYKQMQNFPNSNILVSLFSFNLWKNNKSSETQMVSNYIPAAHVCPHFPWFPW